MTIFENTKKLLEEIECGNGFGEQVTLVAATKTRTAEEINEAISAGVTDIGENRVQEFREKYDLVHGARRHFIGHLQTNKVKYLVGKCDLLHSLDRDELADAVDLLSQKKGLRQPALVQVNIGCEESKGGYSPEEAWEKFSTLRKREGLKICGFMAMLPISDDVALLQDLCKKMRTLFERARDTDENVRYLSMGMSGDFRLCMENGSNMVRVGTAIFGERK